MIKDAGVPDACRICDTGYLMMMYEVWEKEVSV